MRESIEASWKDLVFAFRSLLKSPTFTIVCVLSLAVGIGSNVGVFLFFRTLWAVPDPVTSSDLLELVARPITTERAALMGGLSDEWSYPDYTDLRDATTGLDVSAWAQAPATLRTTDELGATSVPALYVEAGYLEMIGVAPARGRGFTADDALPGAPNVVIVGWDLWQNQLGGEEDLVGRTVTINGSEHTVVGIAPDGFRGHRTGEEGRPGDVFLPLLEHPAVGQTGAVLLDRSGEWLGLLARTRDGMSLEQVNAELSTVMGQLAGAYPATNSGKGAEAFELRGVPAVMRFEIKFVQGAMLSASGIVLLVVCLNIAGMVLVRSAARERELAVRLAIGSSRGQLVRTMMSESLLLSLASGLVAVTGIFGTLRFISWRFNVPLPSAMDPDLRLFAACVGFSLLATMTVGLWPALRFSRPGLFATLRGSASGAGMRTGRMHRWAAATQAALALPFLVVGAIYLDRARTAVFDLGFEPESIFAVTLNLGAAGYSAEEADAFLRRISGEIALRDDVTSVSLADGLPLDFRRRPARVAREGDPNLQSVQTTRVSEGYFATIGTPIRAGRDVSAEDRAGSEPVALITEALATQLWPGGSALGERLRFVSERSDERELRVVGVVADVASSQVAIEREAVFLPLAQNASDIVHVVGRATTAPDGMVSALQETVTRADRNLIRPDVITGNGLVDETIGDLITASVVSGIFAVIALFLAALGVYGIVAFMVAARTREFGVRMAIGASRSRVLREVSRDAVKLVLPGLLGGTLLVWAFLRVKSDIPRISLPMTLAAFGVAALTSIAIAVIASLGPAYRASSVQPAEAMRPE